MQLFERFFFRKVDVFYSETKDETDYLKKVTPKSKVIFQSMGIEEEYFENEKKEFARKKLGFKKEKKYLLFLGRVKTTKGMRELLSAMKDIQEKYIELLIVGAGADYEFFKNYAEEKKIENTKFLGPIYGDKKLLYLSACDCLILPSYTESCPVSIMEAIARNLPVIATDVGGIPLMIENGREGIIIKPKSSKEITKAIREILKWKKKDIKRYADRYRWKSIIENTVKDYKN
jgi:teichuronic acid biosynthesis glycosyltransferase TuaC